MLLCQDDPSFEIKSIFTIAQGFINQNRQGGNVLVHCMVGISRSVTVVTSYLMMKWGMIMEDALRHVIAQRPLVNPNKGFVR